MKHAFTLIELAIVLVIIGLIVGGVIAGQSLIRASELRAVTTEFNQFQTALITFKGKYFAMPGDIDNATSFWGDNASVCPDANITDGSPGTCNGNANGLLNSPIPVGSNGETFMFWNQLALAGLIEGSYTGIGGADNAHDVRIGENIPESKLSPAGWYPVNIGVSSGNSIFFDMRYDNTLVFGAKAGVTYNFGGALEPLEASNIDEKIDDGQPGRGSVIAVRWNQCTVADDETEIDEAYDFSRSERICALAFPKVLP